MVYDGQWAYLRDRIGYASRIGREVSIYGSRILKAGLFYKRTIQPTQYFKQDDVVDIDLDLTIYTLTFKINGIFIEKIFLDIWDIWNVTKFRLAIGFNGSTARSKVKLLSFSVRDEILVERESKSLVSYVTVPDL